MILSSVTNSFERDYVQADANNEMLSSMLGIHDQSTTEANDDDAAEASNEEDYILKQRASPSDIKCELRHIYDLIDSLPNTAFKPTSDNI